METTQPASKTPGYNCRLEIFFKTNAKGQRQAFRYSRMQMRAFRMNLVEAELAIAQDQADKLHCHPMKPCATCDGAA